MIFPCFFPWYSHDFPIIFQWFSHDFPMIFPLFFPLFPENSGPVRGTAPPPASAPGSPAPAPAPAAAAQTRRRRRRRRRHRGRPWPKAGPGTGKGSADGRSMGEFWGFFFSGFFRMELFGGNPNPVPECDGHLNRKSLVFFFHLVTCPFCLVHLRTGMISLAKMTWFDHGETENFRGDRPISIQKLGTFTNKTFKTWEMWKWTKWTHKMSRISTLSTGSSSWLSSGCPWLSSGALSKTEEAARSAARLGRAKKGAVLIIQRYHLVTHGKMTLFRL